MQAAELLREAVIGDHLIKPGSWMPREMGGRRAVAGPRPCWVLRPMSWPCSDTGDVNVVKEFG